jgi:predicted metalloprotease
VKIGGVGLLVVVVISVLLGQNPLVILSELQGTDPTSRPVQSAPPGRPSSPPLRDENEQFVARILGDTEDTWDRIFEQLGGRYAPPRLVLFRGAVDSACGLASAAVGPFYCPGDRRVYLDIPSSGSCGIALARPATSRAPT